MASDEIILCFDAYGTLLSTASIARQLAEHFGEEKADTISTAWRKYQLEYTWRLNSMGSYEPFSALTRRALQHALAESSVSLAPAAIDALMQAYDGLAVFPDVVPGLRQVAAHPHLAAVVFSNGTAAMVRRSVRSSAELAPLAHAFRDIVVVEEVRRFKPAPAVYEHLARKVGKEGRMGELWLVSGNPFDVVGARAMGMQVAWVDREGKGWVDGLVEGEKGRPTVVVRGLDEVVGKVEEWRKNQKA